jgi:hypothetical protein
MKSDTIPDYCEPFRVPEAYRGLISLLRFFKQSGHLYIIDRLANTINAQDALSIIREMLSLVSRLSPMSPDGRVCISEEVIDEYEAMWRERLGAIVKSLEDVGKGKKWIVSVPCPYLPSDEELRRFSECVEKGWLKPSTVAVYAYAPHER